MKKIKALLISLIYIVLPVVMNAINNTIKEWKLTEAYFGCSIFKKVCGLSLSWALLLLFMLLFTTFAQKALQTNSLFKWLPLLFYVIGCVIVNLINTGNVSVHYANILYYGSPMSEVIITLFLYIICLNIYYKLTHQSTKDNNRGNC